MNKLLTAFAVMVFLTTSTAGTFSQTNSCEFDTQASIIIQNEKMEVVESFSGDKAREVHNALLKETNRRGIVVEADEHLKTIDEFIIYQSPHRVGLYIGLFKKQGCFLKDYVFINATFFKEVVGEKS